MKPFSQRRFVFFGLILLLGALLVAKFVSPLYTRAINAGNSAPPDTSNTPSPSNYAGINGDKVGPEFAFYDQGNENSIGQMVSSKNFKGATQVINSITDAPYNPAPGTAETLRIAGISSETNDSDIVKYANALNSFSDFPAGITVIFGNEDNNLDSQEWNTPHGDIAAAAQAYAKKFMLFSSTIADHSKYKVSPAPPDMYNGVYDPVAWINSFVSSGACSNVDARVANVFDVTPRVPGANLDSWQYVRDHLCPGHGDLTHFGGWGPNPNNMPTLSSQVQWFLTTPLPAGINTATTLIVNTCFGLNGNATNVPADQKWLFYIQGKIYDKTGKEIDPATCGASATNSPYYEFNIQREKSQTVLNNFYDEYSVACLPKEEYSVAFPDVSKCGQPNVTCPANYDKDWNIAGNLQFTVDGKAFGLFRDEAAVNSRNASGTGTAPGRVESVESYLSTPNQAAPTAVDASNPKSLSISQAPLYSLTTLEQQCGFVLNKLNAVHNLCLPANRVDTYTTAGQVSPGPTDKGCGLNTSIPGTSTPYTQESMLTAFQNKGMTCQQLADSTNQNDKQFLTDLLKTSISMETAYRPAFIVAVTTFDDPKSGDNVTTHTDQNSGGEPTPAIPGQFQVVDYLEVKIPAIATDFLPPGSDQSSDTNQINTSRNNYQDPMQITANLLNPLDNIQAYITQQQKDRAAMREYSKSSIQPYGKFIGNYGNMSIFCNVNGKLVENCNVPPSSGTDFKDQIPQALVKFINANANVKEHGIWESLSCDGHDADVYSPNNKAQIAEQAKTILSKFSSPKVGPYDKKSEISTPITAKIKDVTKPGAIQTHTQLYFVTPQRYAMEFARDSFLAFLTNDQQAAFNLDPRVVSQTQAAVQDPSQFSPLLKSEINKSLTGEQSKGDGQEITGYQAVPNSSDSLTNPNQTTGSTNTGFHQVAITNNFPIVGKLQEMSENKTTQSLFSRLAGQVASLPTRMMALLTTPLGSQANDYTKACHGNYATEDWLTGKCVASTTAGTTTAAPAATGNVCVETKITDQAILAKYAADLKSYLGMATNQSMWSAYFAGYKRGATQYLFTSNDVCNFGSYNNVCYANVIDYAVQNNINPYLAIAIALNETGGLKSDLPLGVGPHFGCGVNTDPTLKQVIGNGTPASKLQCMIGAFNDYANSGKSANDALTTYGYSNGVHNHNLNTIIGLLSNNTYVGVCQ